MTDKPMTESIESTSDATLANRASPGAGSRHVGPRHATPTMTRIALQTMIVALAASAGGFGGGYFFTERAALRDRDQVAYQERIAALEQELGELRQSTDRMQHVEVDLTDVLEPIREAVARVALVKLNAISKEITAELANVVAADLAHPSATASRATLDPRSADPTPALPVEPVGGAVDEPEGLDIVQGEDIVTNTTDGADTVVDEEAPLLELDPARLFPGATAQLSEEDSVADDAGPQATPRPAVPGETVPELYEIVTSPDTETTNLVDDTDARGATGSPLAAVESGDPRAEGGVGDDAADATTDPSDDPPISESSPR